MTGSPGTGAEDDESPETRHDGLDDGYGIGVDDGRAEPPSPEVTTGPNSTAPPSQTNVFVHEIADPRIDFRRVLNRTRSARPWPR
jgi:hypothetical protein